MVRIACVVLLLTVAGTASAVEPDWLQALRAREAKPATVREVRSPDSWFRARVPANLIGKVEADDGSYSMSFELAPDIAVSCEVIRDGFDIASLLWNTTDASFKLIADEQGKIALRAVERTDAGHFNGSPFIAVDWVYRVETSEGAKVGSLKQVAALKDGHGVYCAQNDVGYSKSFETVVRAFVDSLQVKDPPAPGLYDDISVVSLGGAKVGIATSTIARDSEGDLRVQTATAMLVPVTSDTLRAEDAVNVQFVRRDGTLINALHVTVSNGEIATDLKLQPLDGGGWQVTGQFKGKALEGRLEGEQVPTTFLQQATVRKALLGRPDPAGGENVEWQWLAIDPLRLTEARLKVVAPAGEGLYKAYESAGPLQADTVLERATGFTQRADIKLGPLVVTAERVYARGGL
jgi:hypothetical protein